ncbi:subtilisin-like protease SBT1.7 [Dendrobium catenatum]|uniref:Subtilisin-like protease n=1 Tax=Dendrobium catenatum TaxID=906689 RepID=A0A2I0VTC1_9ASPA|nr:subtilisin-like protease SBT1.7 [Dendrobium catenatum]PKU66660.1 Subtilisin-like protease [Dendrobium catenatum]
MDISISIARFLPLFLFFNIASSLPVHEKLSLPISETIAFQNHQVYIVHVKKPTAKKFHLFKHRKSWYQSFLPNNTLFSGEPRLVYAYRQVITGFAAWLTKGELKSMESIEGFLLARPDAALQHRTTYTPKYLGLDRAQGMWFESGYGQGQIIAVIDSGVKPTHPSFNGHALPPRPTKWNGSCYWGSPICNNKLIGAQGLRLGSDAPLDTEGHGSHCAGIAAGNFVDHANILGQAPGTAAGIAPRAHLAVYKLASAADLLASIDDAIRDNVDVLSISQGDTSPEFYLNGIVIGSYAAMKKDIVTCASAPNYGPSESTMDNDAPWIITVGAASTDRRIMATVKLGDGREFNGESAYQPSNYGSPQLPLVEVLRCFGDNLLDVKGKIVLCKSGVNDTSTGEQVSKAGGAAMIIIGTDGNTTFAQPHVLPASFVTSYAGKQLMDYSNSEPNPTASIIFKGTQFGVQPSPEVASFSGRGPSNWNGGIIKPNVIAPGVNILSAWPFEIGPNHTNTRLIFSFQSGCSMATPHVAGLAALLKNNHPAWSVAAIISAIMTTTYITDQNGKPFLDGYDGKKASVFATGSGHINPVAANDPGLIYDIQPLDYIRYLCGSNMFDDKQVNAIIRGNITCSTIRDIKVEDLNYPSISVSLGINDDIKTVSRTVMNVGDADTIYNVDFEEPKGVNIVVSPTVLHFNKVGDKKSFNVTLNYKSSVPIPVGEISEGQLSWVSGKYLVRSPIAVTAIIAPRIQNVARFNNMGHVKEN